VIADEQNELFLPCKLPYWYSMNIYHTVLLEEKRLCKKQVASNYVITKEIPRFNTSFGSAKITNTLVSGTEPLGIGPGMTMSTL